MMFYGEPGAIAQLYNPSYSAGRDQEDCSLRRKDLEAPI
jgi:hypothetical protein